jgi:transcriptional regulator
MSHYPKRQFTVQEWPVLQTLIEQFPLATLVDESHQVCFLPLMVSEGELILSGHAAVYNPILKNQGRSVTAIFNGTDHYISPNLVPDQVLPTWHYQRVVIKGTLNIIQDPAEAWSWMKQQVKLVEQPQATPWDADSLSEEQQRKLMKQIQVFTISIDSYVGNFKLSQHKPQAHQNAIKAALNL